MNRQDWIKGLLASAISSASTAILAVLGVPIMGMTINLRQLAVFIAADIIVSLATFLKANPLPSSGRVDMVIAPPQANLSTPNQPIAKIDK